MSVINFGTTVSLEQAAQIIARTPKNRFLIQGEMGVGKSSILKRVTEIASELYGAKYLPAYCDVPNMDLGDTAMPVVDHETHTTKYYPNARFRLTEGSPVAVMLDEFTKGAEPVKNMLHPMLEVANPRLGDISLPEGCIVFMTGNLGTDGVGDAMKAHTRNRITTLTIRKPSSDEWLAWAVNNNINPVVMAWVQQFPHALASYTDPSQVDNPYIYNPRKAQAAYVSPRSLERASNIVDVREYVEVDTFIASLAGTIGEAAARDMEAYVAYQDQLPSWDNIVSHPDTAPVPDSPGACAVLVFGAVTKVEKADIDKVVKYISRMAAEWQAAFVINLMKSPKQSVALSSKGCSDWLRENMDIL